MSKNSIVTSISFDNGMDLIQDLKRLEVAIKHDGECSCQVGFYLENGDFLRFGVTDDDVAGDAVGKMWVDILNTSKYRGAGKST